MDSLEYSASAFLLKPFNFLQEILGLKEPPSLSFEGVPSPGNLQELFREKIIAS